MGHIISTCKKYLKLIVLYTTNKATEDIAAGDNIIQLLRSRTTLGQDFLKTSDLLGSVGLVLAQLLSSLDIVLSILILKALGGLLNLNSQLIQLLCRDVLGNNLIEHSDSTGGAVKTTSSSTVSAGLLVDELDKGLLRASTGVGLGLGGALGEELDGGVSGDTLLLGQGTGVFRFSIDLGDNDVGFEGVVIGEGFPGGNEALAV